MGVTDDLFDVIYHRYAPGETFTLSNVTTIARARNITGSPHTVRRTMQELRGQGLVTFVNNNGTYRRQPTFGESDNSLRSNFIDAQKQQPGNANLRQDASEKTNRLAEKFKRESETTLSDVGELISDAKGTRTEIATTVMTRLGQGTFREKLINYWNGCAVTGCEFLRILRASHIKPWKVSNDRERLDVYNGLLLIPNLDALFDCGLITFNDRGGLIVSEILTPEDRKLLRIPLRTSIRIEHGHKKYLAYHREEIFVGAT